MLCLVTQMFLALCNPIDCSPPGTSVHGDSPGKNIGEGCHALLQRIFATQGLNPGLSHYRQILYHPSHQESPSVRVALIKKTRKMCRQEYGEKRILVPCWWKCKLMQTLWKTVRRFLKKIKTRTTMLLLLSCFSRVQLCATP